MSAVVLPQAVVELTGMLTVRSAWLVSAAHADRADDRLRRLDQVEADVAGRPGMPSSVAGIARPS